MYENVLSDFDKMKYAYMIREGKDPSFILEDNSSDIIDDDIYDFISESKAPTTSIFKEKLYPIVEETLDIPRNNLKFKQLVGSYIDDHSNILNANGPSKQLIFGDIDKTNIYNIFGLKKEDITKLIKEVLKGMQSSTGFQLLNRHPENWLFYLITRYYHLHKDEKGINVSLVITILSDYSASYKNIFRYDPREDVMNYTIDHLTYQNYFKKGGSLFGGLMMTMQQIYNFLSPFMEDGSDAEIIRYIQRVRNSDKIALKKLMDKYMSNYNSGLKDTLTKDVNADIAFDDDKENNTSIILNLSQAITSQIMSNGLDLKRVGLAKSAGRISMVECRFYLSKIIIEDRSDEIEKFIQSILFKYLYDDHHKKSDINSIQFLYYALDLFKRTNSSDPNILRVKDTLNLWSEETGIHSKYTRTATRINYKKAIFMYFIYSIQDYNK